MWNGFEMGLLLGKLGSIGFDFELAEMNAKLGFLFCSLRIIS